MDPYNKHSTDDVLGETPNKVGVLFFVRLVDTHRNPYNKHVLGGTAVQKPGFGPDAVNTVSTAYPGATYLPFGEGWVPSTRLNIIFFFLDSRLSVPTGIACINRSGMSFFFILISAILLWGVGYTAAEPTCKSIYRSNSRVMTIYRGCD